MSSASVGVVPGSFDWSNCIFERRLLPPGGGDEPMVSRQARVEVPYLGPVGALHAQGWGHQWDSTIGEPEDS